MIRRLDKFEAGFGIGGLLISIIVSIISGWRDGLTFLGGFAAIITLYEVLFKRQWDEKRIEKLQEERAKLPGPPPPSLDGLPQQGRTVRSIVIEALEAEKEYRYEDAIRLWKKLEIRRDIDESGRCVAYIHLATLCGRLHDYDDSLFYAQKGKKLADKIEGDLGKDFLIKALNLLGIVSHEKNDFQSAIKYHEKELQIAESLCDEQSKADAFGNLGRAYLRLNDPIKAIEFHKKALDIYMKHKNHYEIVTALNNIGLVHFKKEEYQETKVYLKKGLGISKENNNLYGLIVSLRNLGGVYLITENYSKAESYFCDAIELDKKIGNEIELAKDLVNLATVYFKREEYDKADEIYVKILPLFKEKGFLEEYFQFHLNHLRIRLIKNDMEGAIKAAGEGIAVADKLPNMAKELGQLKQIIELAKKALAESQNETNPSGGEDSSEE